MAEMVELLRAADGRLVEGKVVELLRAADGRQGEVTGPPATEGRQGDEVMGPAAAAAAASFFW